jgi:hypothetical protein
MSMPRLLARLGQQAIECLRRRPPLGTVGAFWAIVVWRDDAWETIVPEAVVRGPMKKLIAANVAE